ncbi:MULTISPECIES: DivIVA domain-containing protein [unclassified Ruminococcus]|uniref:DivIVA domain-containing protein n=1 Tax=unclassified Ruminococcus TaxID=2608920 RepID=UPI0021091FD2|nr:MULTISPECIES: DivIVA domain-containing protein [unclassified Ruminococcus]MCQ4023136.1 DivIVA domain-containing protein [Ruminococcus sp. zg-924]MCQ4115093.1 DivIVA domain-containing protein [Ruminococcus sp. zg-921]
MLTIDEVKNISFRKANLGGFRPDDVEVFIEDVVATLEQNKKDKIELVKKLDILAKRIEEYRRDEENVRGALINAQKVMDATKKEANEQAEKIVNDAKVKAHDIIVNANAAVVEQKNNYLKLQADAVVLREQLLEIYKNHLALIDELPTVEDMSKTKNELDRKYPVDENAVYTPVAHSEVEKTVNEITKETAPKDKDVVDITTEFSTDAVQKAAEEAVSNAQSEE